MTVRLNFEPSGRPSSEYDQYYLLDKVNKCVVCGKDESFLRKNIVPHEYRKHFPEHLKVPFCQMVINYNFIITLRNYRIIKVTIFYCCASNATLFATHTRTVSRLIYPSSVTLPLEPKETLRLPVFHYLI